ncbi:serine/threonine-protein phosphatase 6 regulatory ankyrin repeat subunit C-like [Haliotis rufescens]|uniref:serine/threonine-protein phosphatase 6 regulatory ankyrin repeat subunit C-like n=1 Tax=Haliotis rufescens TaxID=6454 RepID=UPI00201F0DED|nr:serine/threonine-protein phosphatase 6 regulatory ankyrin repeat subunit C-like [Haliotis rufescens]
MVDIYSRGRKKKTPVIVAAEQGSRVMVHLLVSEGADVSLVDRASHNILHLACQTGNVEVVKYVLSQDLVDINSRGWYSKTPVMLAAWEGHRDVVELLVNNGADVSLVDKGGNNILHYACDEAYLEVVKYVLSQNGVDINARTDSNQGVENADSKRRAWSSFATWW